MVCGATAFAQTPRPSVMPFPLDFKRAPSGFSQEDKETMQREYTRLLRLAGAMVPDFGRYDLALKELKRTDCERQDECLVQLAQKAEALYGLYASVDYTIEGAVVVSGRVVREDGKVASPSNSVKLAKGRDSFKDIAKNGLVQLFSQLKVGDLPATRQVEPLKELPPPPPPLVIEDRGAGQRSAGKALLFTGVGLAAVGGAMAAIGCGFGCGATPTSSGSLPLAQLRGVQTGQTLTAIGWAGLGAGAVAAAVGAILWGTALPAPVGQVTVVPMAGGAMVQIGGAF